MKGDTIMYSVILQIYFKGQFLGTTKLSQLFETSEEAIAAANKFLPKGGMSYKSKVCRVPIMESVVA